MTGLTGGYKEVYFKIKDDKPQNSVPCALNITGLNFYQKEHFSEKGEADSAYVPPTINSLSGSR